MSSQAFLTDRERGRPAQQYVAKMLRSWGLDVYEVDDGFFQDYDLIAWGKDGKKHTIEVKFDIRASETHNLFLEIEALFHSKAELLAIVTDNPRTVYLTPLQPVLAFAHNWPRKIAAGEFKGEGAVVPIKDFINKLNPEVLTTNK